jgi:PAS domain S-box-containing protein
MYTSRTAEWRQEILRSREGLLQRLMIGTVGMGLLAMGLLYVGLADTSMSPLERLADMIPFIAAWLVVLAACVWRRLGYHVRAWLLLLLCWGLGAFLLQKAGLSGSGRMWIVLLPVLVFVLIAPRAAMIGSAISLMTYAAAAIALALGWITHDIRDPAASFYWITEGGDFVLALVCLGIVIWSYDQGWSNALRKAGEANQQLETKTQELAQEEHLLHTLMDSIPDHIYFKDAKSRFVRINRAQAQYLGVSEPEEAVGKSDRDFLPSESAQRAFDEEQSILRSGSPLIASEVPIVARDGGRLWVSDTKIPLADEDGQAVRLVGITRDITERKQIEEALRRRNRELILLDYANQALTSTMKLELVLGIVLHEATQLLEVAACSIWLIDQETGGLVCREASGPKSDDVRGWKLAPGEGIAGWVVQNKESLTVSDTLSDERHFKAVDEETGMALRSILCVPLRVEGNVTGVLQIADTTPNRFGPEDQELAESLTVSAAVAIANARLYEAAQQELAERRRAEKALAQKAAELSASNAELNQFFFVSSHHLQEPVRSIVSYLQLLQRRYEGKLGEDADEFISYAVNGAIRMRELINGQIAYAHIGTHGRTFMPTDCSAAVDSVLNGLRPVIEEHNATVTRDELPSISADSNQILQLFHHLIDNAIKFKGDEPPRVHISARQEDDQWVFTIQDNGLGIAPQYFDRIFEIFQRLHKGEEYPGTGIGLAICKKIIERHGGHIWVESEPGQGSTFYFTIPHRRIAPSPDDADPVVS